MISIIAPSKTLNMSPPPSWVRGQTPQRAEQAALIVRTLQTMSIHELSTAMRVSEAIARTNHTRLAEWGTHAKPALWMYRGDVYKGMYADMLTEHQAAWAQQHLRIMSGLYGVLRPNDLISPYRLEMKAKIPVAGVNDLYAFWSDTLARSLDAESNGVICVLSSEEYARPVTKYSQSTLVTPVFMDHKPNGKVEPVPIYSKMMRGVMARWMIEHEIDTPDQLRAFTGHGYVYDADRSQPHQPVFVRPAPMVPLVF